MRVVSSFSPFCLLIVGWFFFEHVNGASHFTHDVQVLSAGFFTLCALHASIGFFAFDVCVAGTRVVFPAPVARVLDAGHDGWYVDTLRAGHAVFAVRAE